MIYSTYEYTEATFTYIFNYCIVKGDIWIHQMDITRYLAYKLSIPGYIFDIESFEEDVYDIMKEIRAFGKVK
jgi:hypothetical protein